MPGLTGQFKIDSWVEETYQELGGGAKLTEARVTQTFEGGISGKGSVRWLMAYRPDGTAHYVGLQRVEGTVQGREGTFIAETVGDFDSKVARWTWSIVPGSGTYGLAGLKGTGTFEAPHGGSASFELDIECE